MRSGQQNNRPLLCCFEPSTNLDGDIATLSERHPHQNNIHQDIHHCADYQEIQKRHIHTGKQPHENQIQHNRHRSYTIVELQQLIRDIGN